MTVDKPCPLCGGDLVVRREPSRLVCRDCCRVWSITEVKRLERMSRQEKAETR